MVCLALSCFYSTPNFVTIKTMAKAGAVIKLGLICSVCKSRNYNTSKNKLENKEKMALNKYCRKCRKHTEHKETEKLD